MMMMVQIIGNKGLRQVLTKRGFHVGTKKELVEILLEKYDDSA